MIVTCDEEAKNLLSKHAIFEISDDDYGFINFLFVIPKSSGEFRKIINLKPLNAFTEYEHFKMEGIETFKSLIRQGDLIAKIDLLQILTIPFHPSQQNFFVLPGKIRLTNLLVYLLAYVPHQGFSEKY